MFGLGPAGTGKTYLAVAAAVDLLMTGQVERIILSRPAVEAGERLGFLPGDLRDKVDPYLRPIFDALNDMLPADQLAKRLGNGEIEVAPIAFMRGRTLAHAFVILDEAQNTTPVQMKMFLTRLGEGSRMVVTGDPTQVDLPPGTRSGLAEALETLEDVDGIAIVPPDRARRGAARVRRPHRRAPTKRATARRARQSRRRIGRDRIARHAIGRERIDSCRGGRLALRRLGLDLPGCRRSGSCRRPRRAGAWHQGQRDRAADGDRTRRHASPTMPSSSALNRDWRGLDRPTNVLAFPVLGAGRADPIRARRCCSAMSCSPSRRWRARRRSRASRSATISPIWSCTACCICSAMITPTRPRRPRWKSLEIAILAEPGGAGSVSRHHVTSSSRTHFPDDRPRAARKSAASPSMIGAVTRLRGLLRLIRRPRNGESLRETIDEMIEEPPGDDPDPLGAHERVLIGNILKGHDRPPPT